MHTPMRLRGRQPEKTKPSKWYWNPEGKNGLNAIGYANAFLLLALLGGLIWFGLRVWVDSL
ncbi:MAG TPA: hypothetical protein VK638_12680 [Edaphobacter sp.]|nr:hypothetical protein [Edaphobacter sp.]